MLEINAFCGGFCATNGYLVTPTGGQDPFLVDAPAGIASWVESAGLRPSALVLTHQHFDHVEDVAVLVDRYSLPVYAWSAPSPDLTLQDYVSVMGIDFSLEPYGVDHLLSEPGEGRFQVSGVEFEILHVPGHSPDSICFYHGDEGVLLAGDVLMCGGYGRTDFPHGDEELLFRGIREKIWNLPDSTVVLSGHGPVTTTGAEKERGLIP